jgi:hypothetical protein
MEHCKMNCGADSRKASSVLERNISFWMFAMLFALDGRLESMKYKANQSLKFLENIEFLKMGNLKNSLVIIIFFLEIRSKWHILFTFFSKISVEIIINFKVKRTFF